MAERLNRIQGISVPSVNGEAAAADIVRDSAHHFSVAARPGQASAFADTLATILGLA
jgi:hypothetical protein